MLTQLKYAVMVIPMLGIPSIGFCDSVNQIAESIARESQQKPNTNEYESIAEEIQRQSVKQLERHFQSEREKRDIAPVNNQGQQIYLFVSRSLGKAALEEALSAAARFDMLAVFRGIPKGLKIDEGFQQIYTIAKTIEPSPEIVLDPKRWKKWEIKAVPTIVVAENDKPIARVEGLTEPDWLLDKLEAGKTGDFGNRGTTKLASEPDLIEVMKSRARAIDWEKKKKKAMGGYFRNVDFIRLEKAKEDRTRTISLASRVTRDIVTDDGQVIAHAGDVIDPLKVRKFTRRLVVFDPTIKSQKAFAKKQAQKHDNTLLLATNLQRDRGWEGVKELDETMGEPVYLLDSQLKQRFHLEYVPAIVFQDDHDDHVLTVREKVPHD